MLEKGRVLTRGETERYIISERLTGKYGSVDGGRAARFRLAQDGISGLLSGTDDPTRRAEFAGVLNSLRAFSGEFAKYAESRAAYESARQVYEDYLAGPDSASGSMLIPVEISGEKVRINAADLADIAYASEQRIKSIAQARSRAAEQEFGAGRVVDGVDFYGLPTPECADAILGFAGNIVQGKPPEGSTQRAFAVLNQRLAEKHAEREKPHMDPQPGSRTDSEKAQEESAQPDIREQLDRAMERIAALEEQNRRLVERSRLLERSAMAHDLPHSGQKSAPGHVEKPRTVRERISFKELLAEAGAHSTLTAAEGVSAEKSAQKSERNL